MHDQYAIKSDNNLQEIITSLRTNDNKIKHTAIQHLLRALKSEHSILIYNSLQKYMSELELVYKTLKGDDKKLLADILSFINVTDKRIVQYRHLGGILPLDFFGHQYAKDLLRNMVESKDIDREMFEETIEYLFNNNSEIDGIDFCIEVADSINITIIILNNINQRNYKKVVEYLRELNNYLNLNDLLFQIYSKFDKFKEKIYCILNTDDRLVKEETLKIMWNNSTEKEKIEICLILEHIKAHFEFIPQKYQEIVCLKYFEKIMHHAIEDFEIDLSNTAEEVALSSRNNEFLSIADGFYNFGMGGIKYINELQLKDNYKSMISFISIGLVNYGNVLLNDKLSSYFFSTDTYLKAGSLSALGFSNSLFDDFHSILGLLDEIMKGKDEFQKIISVLTLENLYCDSHNEIVKNILIEHINKDSELLNGMICFTLGSAFLGSFDSQLIDLLLSGLLSKQSYRKDLSFKFITLGLALLIKADTLNTQQEKTVNHIIKSIKDLIDDSQDIIIFLNAICHLNEKTEPFIEELFKSSFFITDDNSEVSSSKNEELERNMAIFSLSLGNNNEMSNELFQRLISTISLIEDESMLSTCSLTLAMLSPSQPTSFLIDQLIRIANKGNPRTQSISLLSLAIIGGGSKNSKILQYINEQSELLSDEPRMLDFLKILKGIVELSRGTHCFVKDVYNKKLKHSKGFVGLLSFLFILLDDEVEKYSSRNLVIEKYPWLCYLLVKSINSKVVSTVYFNDFNDLNDINLVNVEVEVGTPVNVIGAPQQRGICGAQIFKSPVVKQKNEMVLVGDDDCEGVTIVDINS
ncbi:26S proteasome regulatory subunit RPN1 [Cucumispora dikerogammari]|nr:26S proteasome regulatory subunit RPN1 [Cucumispora dikerogammari]